MKLLLQLMNEDTGYHEAPTVNGLPISFDKLCDSEAHAAYMEQPTVGKWWLQDNMSILKVPQTMLFEQRELSTLFLVQQGAEQWHLPRYQLLVQRKGY